ncbi:uncharacterized protein LY89DRAFT_684805 [Mollisia scopiformis]|uniref:Fructose-2,6-bisphosphatase n=1 Tax=Mollisia scopiformis TaxID=149040 RepID=A0A194X984_MOLSC|nr:uncharacterized protein LY89DRAFT_684805 [Mollisia scopiformis]KUJ16728.1 hypothetical protein LY89DRAFT_684805 [Mollisia scopiformis]
MPWVVGGWHPLSCAYFPSYRDVIIRLKPIIMELERSENILIVTHQAILRCIYAYFMKEDQERSPWYMTTATFEEKRECCSH